MDPKIIAALITAVVSLVVALFGVISTKKKLDNERDQWQEKLDSERERWETELDVKLTEMALSILQDQKCQRI